MKTGEIIKYNHTGQGILKDENKVTFISKTVPGDIIDYEITNDKKNYNVAKKIRVITQSKDRIESICPYFEECGGCDFLNISYENSLRYKENKANELLDKFLKDDCKINVEPCQEMLNYRNKISLKIEDSIVGYYHKSSHKLIPIEYCYITKKSINNFIKDINYLNIQNGEVVIKCNENNELLVSAKTNDEINIDIEAIKKQHKLVGIIVNDKIYYGKPFLIEKLNNMLFQISCDAFFQVNNEINGKITNDLKHHLNKKNNVLDLYCGVGSIGIFLSPFVNKVYGIEINQNAIKDALLNSRMNKTNNVQFSLGNVSEVLSKIPFDFDTVIFDPPRSGVMVKDLQYIIEQKPEQIIYISCDMLTLKRDLEQLSKAYSVESIAIYDMFPYTYHVETVVILKICA